MWIATIKSFVHEKWAWSPDAIIAAPIVGVSNEEVSPYSPIVIRQSLSIVNNNERIGGIDLKIGCIKNSKSPARVLLFDVGSPIKKGR
jgi:hypothetical protein